MSQGIAELSGEDRLMIARDLGPKLKEMEKSIERFYSRIKRLEKQEEERKKQEEERKKEMEEMEEYVKEASLALANFRKNVTEKKGGKKRTRRMRNKRLRKSSRK